MMLWQLLPGPIRERYSLVREIGRGSFGTVLLAEHVNPHEKPREVAIKLVRPKESVYDLVKITLRQLTAHDRRGRCLSYYERGLR